MNLRPHGPQPCALPAAPHPVDLRSQDTHLMLDIPRVKARWVSSHILPRKYIIWTPIYMIFRKIIYIQRCPRICLLYLKNKTKYIDKEVHHTNHKDTNEWACNENKQEYEHDSESLYHLHPSSNKFGRKSIQNTRAV